MSEDQGQEEVGRTLVEVFTEPKKKGGRPVGSKNKPKRNTQAEIKALLDEIHRLKTKLAGAAVAPKAEGVSTVVIPEGIPPIPPEDPMAGDKTPEIVEWYRQYFPEEYQARYVARKRKTHLVPFVRKRRDDQIEGDDGKEMKVTHEKALDTEPRFY